MTQETTPTNNSIGYRIPFIDIFINQWPLWIALGALWISTAILQFSAASKTGGHLIYTLDDAYIHMAMAKNLARYGVYGVTRFEFSSASSSPVWTLLVALFYFIFGVHGATPLILNIFVSSLVVVAAYLLMRKHGTSNLLTIFVLLVSAKQTYSA